MGKTVRLVPRISGGFSISSILLPQRYTVNRKNSVLLLSQTKNREYGKGQDRLCMWKLRAGVPEMGGTLSVVWRVGTLYRGFLDVLHA